MRFAPALTGATTLFFASFAQADPIALDWPVDCTMGKTCFIEDYVDHDTALGQKTDFSCGINTRDAHKGTDIALLSFEEITSGVAVLAAAPGRVARTRDEMPDDRLMRGVTSQNACGNAVVIDHADGWETTYCHLRLGSVAVAPGDQVQSGDALGFVGLSGQTNHPHLHFTVRQNGTLIDPFQPGPLDECSATSQSLWAVTPEYDQTGFITAGFTDHIPSMAELSAGGAHLSASLASSPIVVFAQIGYAQEGDVLQLSAQGPSGQIFAQSLTLESPKVNLMRAYGRKAPAGGWPKGAYLGDALLTRQGTVIAHRFAHIDVK